MTSSGVKAIVLGAGMVGSAIAADLARCGFQVAVADSRPEALDAVASRADVHTLVADLSTADEVTRLAGKHDVTIGALPSTMGRQTLEAAIAARARYVDISFMAENALELDEAARRSGAIAVVDCGVAPGVSNLLAGWAARHLQPCERIDIYVGGLPVLRRWPFEYKAGFSPADVIEEYVRPARLVQDGRLTVKEALSEPELVDFPEIGTLEAFNTDGLRSLAFTLRVPSLREKTMRYPGHVALMRALRHMGLFGTDPIDVRAAGGVVQPVRPRDVLAALLCPRGQFEPGEADVTVLRVVADGVQDGSPVRHRWDLIDRYDPQTDTRSMSRTTGYAATSMAALLVQGAVARAGVHAPEQLAADAGFVERFLEEYAARGIRLSHVVEDPQG